MNKFIYILFVVLRCCTPALAQDIYKGLTTYWTLESSANGQSAVGSASLTPTAITYSTSNGIINQGAGFNGTTSLFLGNGDIIPLGAKSICFWAKPTNSNAFAAVMGNNLISSGNNGTEIFGTSGGGATYQFFSGNGSGSTNRFSLTSPTYTVGAWNFFCFTWDGTTTANMVKAYVNAGTPTTATASSTETTPAGITFRVGSISGSNYYTGAMDEIMMWNIALRTDQISYLFDNKIGRTYPLNNNLIFLFNP